MCTDNAGTGETCGHVHGDVTIRSNWSILIDGYVIINRGVSINDISIN